MSKSVPFDISHKFKKSTVFNPLKTEKCKKVLQNRLSGGKIR